MYTSILLVALTGVAPSAEGSKVLTWRGDYAAAAKVAAQEQRPLLVILAPGQGAYDRMGRDGGLSTEARTLLADQYVCVHIDTTTEKGRQLAQAFELEDEMGIYISDRTGDKLAFYHEGDLANADLVRYLERYSDPNRTVEFTESNPGRRHGGGYAYGGGCGGGCGGYSGGCYGGGCGTACSSGCGGGRHHRGGRCGGGHRGGRCR
jgi:hypothetical protein